VSLRLPGTERGRAQAPRLVLRFALFTAVGLSIASVAIFLLVKGFVTAQAQDSVEKNTRFVAEAVLPRKLTPKDFAAPPTPARRVQLDSLFRTQVMLDDVQRVSLYGLDGRVAFSTMRSLVGHRTAESAAAQHSLHGAKIRTSIQRETLPGVPSKTVLKQYVPIWFGNRPAGVLVTSRNYAPIARSVRATFLPIALVLEGLLLALFVSFLPVLRRVTRQMDDHLGQIEHQALHDGLTGLPNRALFRDRIAVSLADARRSEGHSAVLLLDLDRFKEINDTLGHAAGDELLRLLAARLHGALRETDTVARLGGDEFGIVMRVGGPTDVRDAAERIHNALEHPFEIEGLRFEVGASIGASLFPDDATDPDTLVRFADVAMYTAKRNRTDLELYNAAFDDTSRDSLAMGSELRRALDDGDIIAHYQPKVDIESGRIVGAEALVRWNHPDRGLVMPAAFLPTVEKTGLMNQLTAYMLRLAVAQAAEWNRLDVGLGIAVNVDAGALLDPAFPDLVEAALSEGGLPSNCLTLEITETSIMADPLRAGTVARDLASIGVRLAIDDFGTGYSSLGQLTALPLSELKIDRSFVTRLADSPADLTIVRTILDLGASLDLCVVAEGIESSETRSILQGLGCVLAQGYAFGAPVSAADLTKVLLSRPAESTAKHGSRTYAPAAAFAEAPGR
jgi:diguanylate cyclase (GGDEF)-like protein